MWWTRDNTEGSNPAPRCQKCITHPVLVKSGHGDEKSLKCPVCKTLFNSKGVKYDPKALKNDGSKNASIDDELAQEQEELWEYLWGK